MFADLDSLAFSRREDCQISPTRAPMSGLLGCLNEWGDLCVEKWWKQSTLEWMTFKEEGDTVREDECFQPAPKRPKRGREQKGYWDDLKGRWIVPDPLKSSWYINYVLSKRFSTSKKLKKRFRRRFRMKRASFFRLVTLARENQWFPNEEKPDCVGKVGPPLELLLLGALRYLGRGWTFDDLEESTNIGEEKHRRFFHEFIKVGSNNMYTKWVTVPSTQEAIAACGAEYAEAGFDGALFSSDGTHVIMEKCSARLKNAHMGGKMPFTARCYNLSVNHRRQILATSPGCPSRWNDKTVSTFDDFLCEIQAGNLFQNVVFELYNSDGTMSKYRGAWGLVDNGYHKWVTLMPPLKHAAFVKEVRWSKWLESMRKDVECTFGILKGRWRILKTGIRLHSICAVDSIWKTCCALHNFLLNEDGLDTLWEEGVLCDYDGEYGCHDAEDLHRTVHYSANPLALNNFGDRHFDLSGMGFTSRFPGVPSADITASNLPPVAPQNLFRGEDEDIIDIRSLRYEHFRNILITHFDVKWRARKVKWPSRNGAGRPKGWLGEGNNGNEE